jgi:hypothetical protein
VFGGIAITKKRKIGEQVRNIRELCPYPSPMWIFQQLLHPILTFLVIQIYFLNPLSSKLLLFVLKKINAVSLPLTKKDSNLYSENKKTKSYPNALALLAMDQLLRVTVFNKIRGEIYETYKKDLRSLKLSIPINNAFYLRVPVLSENRVQLKDCLKKEGIYLGDWYSNVIDPQWIMTLDYEYTRGSCKNAEKIASKIVNLPSYPTMNTVDAHRVINEIKKYFSSEVDK